MIKKILLGMTLLMSMVSCTEDYTDWGNPQSNPKEEAVSFGNGSVTPVDVINLADVKTEKVKVASIVAPTSSNAAYTPNYKINFDGQSFDIDADGNMATAELTSYIVDKWGKRPTERDIDATLDAWVSNGSTAVKMTTSATFQVKAIPEAPVIEDGYYLVGDMFNVEAVGDAPAVDNVHLTGLRVGIVSSQRVHHHLQELILVDKAVRMAAVDGLQQILTNGQHNGLFLLQIVARIGHGIRCRFFIG